MSESTTTIETGKPEAETPKPAPRYHLLPLHLGKLAIHAGEDNRFSLRSVQVAFKPDNTFAVTATDTKSLARVEGPCREDPESEFPASNIPGLDVAPNGATSSLVPASTWARVFQSVNKMPNVRRSRGVLGSIACVVGAESTTFGATDCERHFCEATANIVGRFPDVEGILNRRPDCRTLTFSVDAKRLAELLRTAADFAGDESNFRVDIEANDRGRPILLRTNDGTHKFTGLIMPLHDGDDKKDEEPETTAATDEVIALRARVAELEAALEAARTVQPVATPQATSPTIDDAHWQTLGQRYVAGESSLALARECGLPETTLRGRLRRMGYKRVQQEVTA